MVAHQYKTQTYPRAVSGDPNQNVRPSTRWIEDGSYLRMKSIIIGYTIPIKYHSL